MAFKQEDGLGPLKDQSKKPGWKPQTLRPPLLSAISIFNLCSIAVLELLSRISASHGGLTSTYTRFSNLTTFMYLYLPLLISVLLSLLWSWIDLDAKRLEPYFQMSKPGGADSDSSLNLHYPFDFIAWAPVKAIRRRSAR